MSSQIDEFIPPTHDPKPDFRIGQSVKMINCPDAEITPDKIWTIRTDPYHFDGKWRVLLNDWVGSFSVSNLVAVNFDESVGDLKC
jgi:hypothetical protein